MPSRTKGIVWQSGIINRGNSNKRTYHTLGHVPLYIVVQHVGGANLNATNLQVSEKTDSSIVVSGPNNVRYRLFALI